ncbi:hypothetical protein AWM75_06900 [Aerococcus urinaehominis]|uniref:Uncharacterized protein n=1 Tax=Aerococcus urinaehominis TaxID=128944 RepID=A0A109RH75_9LACT|nr:divergent PAP2 family protein [Aerococcus urinaehominis]AMB99729.1 hypothetical protein AWM75_06900 [Aerococcus urinaehominis]SDL92167.1 hypothetical protein SAMN04487985_102180 [Aerococcus urinaehominis]
MFNFPLVAGVTAIITTQIIKYPIALIFKRPNANLSIIHATGGMPSSHSAAVTALIVALIFEYGFTSPYVAIAAIFGMIIMFDAMGVRRQSGEQGVLVHYQTKVLKSWAHDHQDQALLDKLQEMDEDDMVINDYLGHKPSEVIGGIITGSLVALLLRYLFTL